MVRAPVYDETSKAASHERVILRTDRQIILLEDLPETAIRAESVFLAALNWTDFR
jgi:hypothetical protein